MGGQIKLSAPLYSNFVGREKEMTKVKGHLEESMKGNGKLVLIIGETGIGKSRLLQELGGYAESKGVLFLKGRGLYQENAEPYLPFMEAFGQYLLSDQDFIDTDARALIGWESEEQISLGILPLGQIRETSVTNEKQGFDLQQERDRLFESLYRIVIDISEKMPLLLVLDDIQWADESSLLLLHYLARNIRNTNVLMCAAYSPEDLKEDDEEAHPLSDTLRRMRTEKLFSEIWLERFDEKCTAIMIESLVGKQGLHKEFVKLLYNASEGNPFFIEEVLKSLVNEGLMDVDSYRWDGNIDASQIRIPGTIRDVIARRIDRLDDKTKSLLRSASIIGNRFTFELLYKISDVSEEDVIDAIDASIAANIIHEDPACEEERYRFDHALIREVIYNSMSRSRRRLMHKKMGYIIEEQNMNRLDEVVYNLAHHFCEGKDAKKTLFYAIKAGEKAKNAYAPEDAIHYFLMALRTIDEMEDNEKNMNKKLDFVAELGEIYGNIGEWDKSQQYHFKALELSKKFRNDIGKARAYRSIGHIKQNKGEYDEAFENFKKGLEISERIKDLHGMADTYRGLGRVFWRKGEFERAIEFYEWSLGLTKKIKDEKLMATTCIELGNVYSELGDWEKGIEYQMNSLKLLEKLKNFYEIGRSYNNIGVTYARKGDMDKAIEQYEKSIEISDKARNIRMSGWALFNAGEAYAKIGEFEKALECCDRSLSIFERLGEKLGISGAYMSYGIIFKLKKQWNKAIEYFEESMRIRKELEIPYRLADGYYEFGMLYKEKGDETKAKEYLIKAMETFKKLGAKKSLKRIELELKNINSMEGAGET
jgi:predicted ATPase